MLMSNFFSGSILQYLTAHMFIFQLVNMIEVIKELANTFVPSGKLIELVDATLVSRGKIQ